MAIKKRVKKSNDLDVNIKVKNLGKAIKEGKKFESCKNKANGCGGNFWVFGSALAIVLSYIKNSSIFWAIVHGAISWFYVIYRIIQNAGWI